LFRERRDVLYTEAIMTVRHGSQNRVCRWLQGHQALICVRAASEVQIDGIPKMRMLEVASTT
jgi:hypothetical protein